MADDSSNQPPPANERRRNGCATLAAGLLILLPLALMAALFLRSGGASWIAVAVTGVAAIWCAIMAGFILGNRIGSKSDSQIGLGCLIAFFLLLVNAALFYLGAYWFTR